MQVIRRWQSIANGRFPDDCRALIKMVDETDEFRLASWEADLSAGAFNVRTCKQRTVTKPERLRNLLHRQKEKSLPCRVRCYNF